jgi:cell pole-organizing protein PopZ
MTDAPKYAHIKRTSGYEANWWGTVTDEFDELAVEYIRADVAEAEKRAAVAAAYEKAAQSWPGLTCDCNDPKVCSSPCALIRALSDTDALAEYAEKVRAKALEEAALECDAIAARRKGTDRGYAAEDCASNIRALKSIRSGDAP